jgi:hypothetical protein
MKPMTLDDAEIRLWPSAKPPVKFPDRTTEQLKRPFGPLILSNVSISVTGLASNPVLFFKV